MKKFLMIAVLMVLVLLPAIAYSITLQQFIVDGRYFYGGPNDRITGVATDGHNLYLLNHDDSLFVYVLDSNGLPTTRVGSCPAAYMEHLYLKNSTLIGMGGISIWAGYQIFDVSNSSGPILDYNYAGGDVIPHAKIYDNKLYAPTGNDIHEGSLNTFDISDQHHPRLISFCSALSGSWCFDFDKKGTVGYVTDQGYQAPAILDMTDPANVVVTGHLPYVSTAIKVHGNSLVTAGPAIGNGPLRIYNISDPLHPALLETANMLPANITDIQLVNGLLYSLSWNGDINLTRVGGNAPPESLAAANIPWSDQTWNMWFPQMACVGNKVYYASGDSGLYVLEYTGEMPAPPGDANNSGAVNGIDVIYLANYFKGWGPPPADPLALGDTNGDCIFNGLDETYLVNYLKGGPLPIRGICYTP
jgi:hypothetical protein